MEPMLSGRCGCAVLIAAALLIVRPCVASGADPPAANDSRLDQVLARIQLHESQPSPVAAGFTAPNRAQNLRVSLGSDAVEMVPRTPPPDGSGWRWRLHRI